eukprot:CAMPEP_0194261186 /NCGR_PEP_ID=MMETSP0158-20130606/45896_1 /TAXON_ID=33649 /ORGANISM="Thalassionema nitzschioides, Strain L26-B" /LENGTH=743 /DNA_ID=CAMNT_0039001301 /DNA_START=41 /DNA_END=2272 /DNA_ORIENTATION=-
MSTLRRRVDFNLATSREERLARNQITYDDSSDEEEQRRIQEEEEEERQLSAINGEAAEESNRKRKTGPQTDQEIEAEYATTTKKRKPRVTLQPSHVIGNEGLVKIRTDFPTILPKLGQRNQKSVQAAAAYSSRLINAYKQWAFQLFPGLGMEDVLSRVETFGSKREVKDYLQTMRDVARNEYLEKVYGRDQAEKMLNELESGLEKQKEEDNEEMVREESIIPGQDIPMEEAAEEAAEVSSPPPAASRVAAPAVTPAVDSDSEEELEFAPAAKPASAQTNSAFLDTDDESSGDEEAGAGAIGKKENKENTDPLSDTTSSGSHEASMNQLSPSRVNNSAASGNFAESESDEAEMDDDEVVPAVNNTALASAPINSAFLDTDDEDDDAGEKVGVLSAVSGNGSESDEGENDDGEPIKPTNSEEITDEEKEEKKVQEVEELASVECDDGIDSSDTAFNPENDNERVETQEEAHSDLGDSSQTHEADTSMESRIQHEMTFETKEVDKLKEVEEGILPSPNSETDFHATSLTSEPTQTPVLTTSTSTGVSEKCVENDQKAAEMRSDEDSNISATLDSETEVSQAQATVFASAPDTLMENTSQTQATILASGAFDEITSQTQATVLAFTIDTPMEDNSQTQATVLASGAFDEAPSQTQAVVLDSATDTPTEDSSQTQATVLASGAFDETTSQTQATVLDSATDNLMEENSQTQATVLASGAFDEAPCQTQATVLASTTESPMQENVLEEN